MTADGDGVLDNLPRTRPGSRSPKRAAPKRRTSGPAAPRGAAVDTADRSPPIGGRDPVTAAARAAEQVARAAVRTAAQVGGGVLRRLPRP
jgi:hypothetical protein